MKEVPKFDNSFWNEEIGNFQGWESVLRRLKDGRQILKEYSEFLKQRAAIEEQLGKALVKLAKTLLIREELDPLRYVWEVLKAETENSGLSHLKSSHQLFAEANRVNELNENYREKRRIREDVVRGHQTNLKIQWKRLCDAKRSYDLRCREEVSSNQFYHQEVARLGKNSREAEKAHSKFAKSRQILDVCESSYQSCVSQVEEARLAWEKETERTMLSFQCLEEDRLSNVRDSLWKVSNVISATSVDDDRCAEEVRKSLEACDLDEAVYKFIANNRTGEKRPEAITFKPQPTSASIGLGRAETASSSSDDGGDTLKTTLRSTTATRKSYADNGVGVVDVVKPKPPAALFDTQSLAAQQQEHSHHQQHLFFTARSQTPFHQFPKAACTATATTTSMSLSSLHEFVRANTNNYNRALNNAINQANIVDPSRSNSQISLATSPDVLQTTPTLTSSTSLATNGHLHPPARPRKPPRLLHYANLTFQSTMATMNRSRSCSPEKPIRILDTVENTEYFNLPDDSGTPPSSDYQSDLSCSGGEQTVGNSGGAGDSGIFTFASPHRRPSSERRNTLNNINITNNGNGNGNNRNTHGGAPRRPASSPTRRNFIDRNFVDHAVVLFDHRKSSTTEISLAKSQVVQILDSSPSSDWWRVRDDAGREGFYPANFLKLI